MRRPPRLAVSLMVLATVAGALGCSETTPIAFDPDTLTRLGHCPTCTGPEPADRPKANMIVAMLYRSELAADCRGCVLRDSDCTRVGMACRCVEEPEDFRSLIDSQVLADVSFPDVDPDQEYCVGVATMLVEDVEGCPCRPEEWLSETEPPLVSSCLWSRQAQRPGGGELVVNGAMCRGELAEPDPAVACEAFEFLVDRLFTCSLIEGL